MVVQGPLSVAPWGPQLGRPSPPIIITIGDTGIWWSMSAITIIRRTDTGTDITITMTLTSILSRSGSAPRPKRTGFLAPSGKATAPRLRPWRAGDKHEEEGMNEIAAGNTICLHCLISGRVQGVFFRASTRSEAQRLGVCGWARNLPDGRVEVLACGPAEAVSRLRDWLRQGPPGAGVTDLECESRPYHHLTGFTTG